MTFIRFQRVHPDAVAPERKSEYAAGYDLYAPEAGVVRAHSVAKVPTGLCLEMPVDRNMYGKIESRSSMALKGIVAVGGIIDKDYRGHVQVLLMNTTLEDYFFKKGDRVAQIIFNLYEDHVQFEEAAELGTTQRGEGGFGSTSN
jgi:dUTP pyrophosphatase